MREQSSSIFMWCLQLVSPYIFFFDWKFIKKYSNLYFGTQRSSYNINLIGFLFRWNSVLNNDVCPCKVNLKNNHDTNIPSLRL